MGPIAHIFSSFQIISFSKRHLCPLQRLSYALEISLSIRSCRENFITCARSPFAASTPYSGWRKRAGYEAPSTFSIVNEIICGSTDSYAKGAMNVAYFLHLQSAKLWRAVCFSIRRVRRKAGH